MAAIETNKTTVRKFIGLLGTDDITGLQNLMADDLQWIVPQDPAFSALAGSRNKWRSFDHGQQTARTVKGWRDKLVKKKDAKFQLLVRQYTRDEVGRQHLKEVLKVGPPHIGGF